MHLVLLQSSLVDCDLRQQRCKWLPGVTHVLAMTQGITTTEHMRHMLMHLEVSGQPAVTAAHELKS